MELSRYLAQTGESQVEFVRRSGVSAPVVSRLVRGIERRPEPETVVRIHEATAGLVTADDLFGHGRGRARDEGRVSAGEAA